MTLQEKETVLVVDDMPENVELLCEILQDDYRMLVALNGEDVLKLVLSSDPPDIVLMDVMMPRMDGYEACRRMQEDIRSRSIPVIFVTAMGEEADETRGFELGAVDYITKPISPAIVQARVRTHLALHNQSVSLEKQVFARTRELYETRLEIVRRLGVAAEYKDNETGNHIIRMSNYCGLMARGVGMSRDRVDLLLNAAPMHDVGKIGIPDSILGKPGKLDPEEWRIMQTHTTIGAEIIGDHDYELMQVAKRIALTHHERWDGSGYPLGLAGDAIPIEGRMAAIADVFDALTSERPYKSAWPAEKAREYIRGERGSHFDPELVDVFESWWEQILDIKGEFP